MRSWMGWDAREQRAMTSRRSRRLHRSSSRASTPRSTSGWTRSARNKQRRCAESARRPRGRGYRLRRRRQRARGGGRGEVRGFLERTHRLAAGRARQARRRGVVPVSSGGGVSVTIVDPGLDQATQQTLATLTSGGVASALAAKDPTLWGPEATPEATIRLGWLDCTVVSRPLVPEIEALRDELLAQGVDRVVLAGMGGSSLAPEVITATYGVPLVTLDTTDPGQVAAALTDLDRTVLVVSSKSGGTIETDSHRRVFEQAFRDAGFDPTGRNVVVTDPGSPLETTAREASYRVFLADPDVGGRYSALTAFGLVPAGLAGVPIGELLDQAAAIEPS